VTTLADHYLTLEDTIDTLEWSLVYVWLRPCHDHKYDPFRQRDYYSLYGIFEITRIRCRGVKRSNAEALVRALTDRASPGHPSLRVAEDSPHDAHLHNAAP